MKAIYARTQYKDIACPERTSILRPLLADHEKAESGKCGNCGKDLFFLPCPFSNIVELACSVECERVLGWTVPYNGRYIAEWQQKKKNKKLNPPCEKCGGPPRGRGWRHKSDCELLVVKKATKPPCKECGGLARGRGWNHMAGCSKDTRPG